VDFWILAPDHSGAFHSEQRTKQQLGSQAQKHSFCDSFGIFGIRAWYRWLESFISNSLLSIEIVDTPESPVEEESLMRDMMDRPTPKADHF